MPRVEETTIRGHIVYRDVTETQRIYEARGPHLVRWVEEFVSVDVDNSTGFPTAYTTSTELAAGSTFALTAGANAGNAVFSADGGTTDDTIQIQLKGEAYTFSAGYPTYFGCKFKVNDADKTLFIGGLCITDTTLGAGLSDGLYFRSAKDSATLYLVAEKDSAETTVSCGTLSDDTFVIAEFYYDGDTVTAYVDGTAITTTIADTDDNFPDDEYLTPSLAMLAGEDDTNSATVEWAHAFQFRR